ncbi:MAG: AAA family ATPase [Candidatus Sumerlaeota bacterium]|nr:AAA family ATPase [Candidatus Sumerlaeota bacterium]
MLRRFQRIGAVGCFVDAHPGSVQFERLAFIYGENCYGKSTLCDILRSFADGAAEYIVERRSVPNPTNASQEVDLTLQIPGQAGEEMFRYRQGSWNPVRPPGLRVLVFDTDFMNRNVFTGLTIERRNQENITQFVLGETGVHTAEQIASLNSELRRTNQRLRDLEATPFAGIAAIQQFVSMDVQESAEAIAEELRRATGRLEATTTLSADIEGARARSEPQALDIPGDVRSFVQRINLCLTSSYARAHTEAEMRIHHHLDQNAADQPNSQAWLREGLSLRTREVCPFCGQPLSEQAVDLLDLYREFFDVAFERYVSEIGDALDHHLREFAALTLAHFPNRIHQNSQILGRYPELAQQDDYREGVNNLEVTAGRLSDALGRWYDLHTQAGESLREIFQQKRLAIHQAMAPWDPGDLLAVFDDVVARSADYGAILQQLSAFIQAFKARLDAASVATEVRALECRVAELDLRRRRLETTDACRIYGELQTQKGELEREIPRLQSQLEVEQTSFLDVYFTSIDALFTQLGSTGFGISKRVNRRGNMPTIQLTATFHGTQIAPDKVRAFFSESDRRALALSIFLAKIQAVATTDRVNIIVALDDPVTSFDDGRIDRTIRMFDNIRPQLRQLIVISHYRRYIHDFFDRVRGQDADVSLAQIIRDHVGSQLARADLRDFVETPHQRMFRHISGFVDRSHRNDVCRDLRVYLETEVRSRFHKQIIDNDLQNLLFGDLLRRLLDASIITPERHQKIEQFLTALNPEHHQWTDRSHEDKLALARDVLTFLYDEL